jgi:hypothetical protein
VRTSAGPRDLGKKGKKGVAAHLAKLSPEAPRYIRVEICGVTRSMQHYYIPCPPTGAIVPLRRH